jgi:hypothetical protein
MDGQTDRMYHLIDTEEVQPIRQSTRTLPLVKQAEVYKMLEDKQRHGVTAPVHYRSHPEEKWRLQCLLRLQEDECYKQRQFPIA